MASPEYGTVYQHQGMLLQNLHCRYLYVVIQLPRLDQKIPSFPNCDNYGIHRASNPNPLNDDTRTNDNELHQQICGHLRLIIYRKWTLIPKARLECKINVTLLALLPNKMTGDSRGSVTSSDKNRHDKLCFRNPYHF